MRQPKRVLVLSPSEHRQTLLGLIHFRILGNSIYMKYLEGTANQAKAMNEPYKSQFIASNGGVNTTATVLAIIGRALLVGILLGYAANDEKTDKKMYVSAINCPKQLGLFLQVVPITCLVGPVYVIYRLVKIKKQQLFVAWGTEIMRCLFVCYLTGLINLILVPSNLWTYIWFYLQNGYSGCELDAYGIPSCFV